MTQVETNVIRAMANAGDVDQTLQNHVLKLVVAHDKAVANYKSAIKTCRILEAELEKAKGAMVENSAEIKPVIDLRKSVDTSAESC
jgi:hypothetical protein